MEIQMDICDRCDKKVSKVVSGDDYIYCVPCAEEMEARGLMQDERQQEEAI